MFVEYFVDGFSAIHKFAQSKIAGIDEQAIEDLGIPGLPGRQRRRVKQDSEDHDPLFYGVLQVWRYGANPGQIRASSE